MVPDGQATLQGLSLIPHLTSVAAALYRNGVINGSEISVGRARAMMQCMHRLVSSYKDIKTGGRRAIGIALYGRGTSSGVYWGRIDAMGSCKA